MLHTPGHSTAEPVPQAVEEVCRDFPEKPALILFFSDFFQLQADRFSFIHGIQQISRSLAVSFFTCGTHCFPINVEDLFFVIFLTEVRIHFRQPLP